MLLAISMASRKDMPTMSTISAPAEWVAAIGELRLPSKADVRLQQLMDRNNEGELSSLETRRTGVLGGIERAAVAGAGRSTATSGARAVSGRQFHVRPLI